VVGGLAFAAAWSVAWLVASRFACSLAWPSVWLATVVDHAYLPMATLPFWDALEFFQVWGHDVSRLFAAHDRYEFKGRTGAAPRKNPFLQQTQIIAFHELKAPT
jgi:hypothetical protein